MFSKNTTTTNGNVTNTTSNIKHHKFSTSKTLCNISSFSKFIIRKFISIVDKSISPISKLTIKSFIISFFSITSNIASTSINIFSEITKTYIIIKYRSSFNHILTIIEEILIILNSILMTSKSDKLTNTRNKISIDKRLMYCFIILFSSINSSFMFSHSFIILFISSILVSCWFSSFNFINIFTIFISKFSTNHRKYWSFISRITHISMKTILTNRTNISIPTSKFSYLFTKPFNVMVSFFCCNRKKTLTNNTTTSFISNNLI